MRGREVPGEIRCVPTLGLQLAQLIVLTTGVGVAMSLLGLRSRLLTLRHEERRCASCGRLSVGRTCSRCGGR